GGLPRGRMTELVGPRSAGRTGLACAVAAGATRAGEAIAWIDPEDALDPAAAAAAGIVLERTLWGRPRRGVDAYRAAAIVLAAGGFGLVVVDATASTPTVPRPEMLARSVERARTALLVLAVRPATGSGAALVLALHPRRVRWSGGSG